MPSSSYSSPIQAEVSFIEIENNTFEDDFEDGVHYSLLVLMLSLVAVLSFPYPVMSLYRWWREIHALPVEVIEPPRTIGEIPTKMIYYI